MGERSRSSLSLRRAWRAARLIVLVTLTAAMLWLYAEGEIVKPHELALSVQFVGPRNGALRVDPAGAIAVRATVRCSASRLAEVQRMTEAGPLTIEVAPAAGVEGASTQDVSLAKRLSSDPRLAGLGVNVSSVTPAVVRVCIASVPRRVE